MVRIPTRELPHAYTLWNSFDGRGSKDRKGDLVHRYHIECLGASRSVLFLFVSFLFQDNHSICEPWKWKREERERTIPRPQSGGVISVILFPHSTTVLYSWFREGKRTQKMDKKKTSRFRCCCCKRRRSSSRSSFSRWPGYFWSPFIALVSERQARQDSSSIAKRQATHSWRDDVCGHITDTFNLVFNPFGLGWDHKLSHLVSSFDLRRLLFKCQNQNWDSKVIRGQKCTFLFLFMLSQYIGLPNSVKY